MAVLRETSRGARVSYQKFQQLVLLLDEIEALEAQIDRVLLGGVAHISSKAQLLDLEQDARSFLMSAQQTYSHVGTLTVEAAEEMAAYHRLCGRLEERIDRIHSKILSRKETFLDSILALVSQVMSAIRGRPQLTFRPS